MIKPVAELSNGHHVAKLVEYLLYDEQKSFLECSDDDARDHIFMALVPVATELGFALDKEAADMFERLAGKSEGEGADIF